MKSRVLLNISPLTVIVLLITSCSSSSKLPSTVIPVEVVDAVTPRPVTEDSVILLLTTGTYQERLNAITWLPNYDIDAQGVTPYLIENLSYEGGYRVQMAAAYTLGEIGEDARVAVPDLIDVMDNNFIYVRKEAAIALGKIGDVSAIPYLAQGLYYQGSLYADLKGISIESAEAMERILSKDFTNSPSGLLNEQGIPIIVLEARNWWESEGQFQDWPILQAND